MAKSELAVNTLQLLTITSTSTPQSTQKPSIKRLAVGPVVGLVVGVSVILAALTGICVFILMRRSPFPRSKERTQSSTPSQINLGKRQSGREVRQEPSVKAQDQSAVPKEEGTVQFIDLDWNLPQPISDSELVQEWGMLCVIIETHVTACYDEDKTGQEYYVDESSPLAYLDSYHLANPKSRHLAIRQSIGKIILENINPEANPNDTFLPPRLVSIIRSMPIKPDEKFPLLEAAFAKWRVITHFLLCPERKKTSTEYMINSDTITKAAEKLSNDLQPYLIPGIVSKEESKASLEKTLRCGAKFGLRLLSQGARWAFGEWDIRERKDKKGRPCLVVLPALLKLTDEDGNFVRDSEVRHEEWCFHF